eukprot:scaffold222_cov175-Amphora_coffeaeformis.AAC.21
MPIQPTPMTMIVLFITLPFALPALVAGFEGRVSPSTFAKDPKPRRGRMLGNYRRKYTAHHLTPADFLKDHRDSTSQVVGDPTPEPSESPSSVPSELPSVFPSGPPTSTQTVSPTLAPDDCLRLDNVIFEEQNDSELDLLGGTESGDVYVFASNTLSTIGYEDGLSAGRCVTLPDPNVINNLYCSIIFQFPEGEIVFAGVFENINALAGTGCFSGLTANVEVGADRDADAFTYSLIEVPDTSPNCDADLLQSPWLQEAGYVYVDWDSNGLSPGDTFVFDQQEVVTSSGEGVLEGECMILEDASEEKAFCLMTFTFGNDALHTMGVYDDMVITGGFGCFAGISGRMQGQVNGPSHQIQLVLDGDESSQGSLCPTDIFDNAWIEEFGETSVDYDGLGDGLGDAYVYDNKQVAIQTSDGEITGVLAGRCFFLEDRATDTFCNTVITLQQGSIALQGFYENMYIVGASGCFQGLTGAVAGGDNEFGFTYTFDVSIQAEIIPDPTISDTPLDTPSLVHSGAPSSVPSETPTSLLAEDCARLDSTLVEEQDDIGLDLFGDGYSAGDVYVFDSNTVSTEGYAPGLSAGRCVVLESVDVENMLYCSIVFDLPEGSIIMQGSFADMDVVSGTGCFNGMAAEVTLGPDEEGFAYDFDPSITQNNICSGTTELLQSEWQQDGSFLFVDWDSNNLSSGDIYVFDQRVVTTPGGETGLLEGECSILMTKDENKPFCSVTFIFGDDRLYAMGLLDDMLIMNGIGCFFGVSGKIRITIGDPFNGVSLSLDPQENVESCPEGEFDGTWIEEFGEAFVDYDGQDTSPGDQYVFDNKNVSVATSTGSFAATTAGRCVFLQDLTNTFCSITLTAAHGTIGLTGFFGNMFIVGVGAIEGCLVLFPVDNQTTALLTTLNSNDPEKMGEITSIEDDLPPTEETIYKTFQAIVKGKLKATSVPKDCATTDFDLNTFALPAVAPFRRRLWARCSPEEIPDDCCDLFIDVLSVFELAARFEQDFSLSFTGARRVECFSTFAELLDREDFFPAPSSDKRESKAVLDAVRSEEACDAFQSSRVSLFWEKVVRRFRGFAALKATIPSSFSTSVIVSKSRLGFSSV